MCVTPLVNVQSCSIQVSGVSGRSPTIPLMNVAAERMELKKEDQSGCGFFF